MYNYLEMEQVIQIRDFILNDNNMQYRARILVAGAVEVQALTGMRIGELLALQVKDVDLKNKTMILMALFTESNVMLDLVTKILRRPQVQKEKSPSIQG